MSDRNMPGAKFWPAPWTYEPAIIEDENCWLVTNTHFKFYARDEAFAKDFVAGHNRREGWAL